MPLQFPPFNDEPEEAPWRRDVVRRLRTLDTGISALSNRVSLQQSTALAQARGVAAQNNNPGSVITRGSDIFFSRNYSTTIPPSSGDYTKIVVGDPTNLDFSKYTSLTMTYTFSTFGSTTATATSILGPFGVQANIELYAPDTGGTIPYGLSVPGTATWVTDRINGGSLVSKQILYSWYFRFSDFDIYVKNYAQIRPVFYVANLSSATPTSVTSFISGNTVAFYRSDYWSNN